MLIIAHRGLTKTYPENTKEAFLDAISCKCPQIEFDVRLSQDNKFFIFHDEDTKRIFPHLKTHYHFSEIHSDILKTLKIDDQYSVPLFTDVIQNLMHDLEFINIEMKTTHLQSFKIAKSLYQKLKPIRNNPKIIVSSFYPLALLFLKFICKDIKRGYLISLEHGSFLLHKIMITLIKPHALHISLDFYRKYQRYLLKTKIPLIFWTINHQEEWAEIKNIPNAIGIITDKPLECMKYFQ